MLVVSDTSPLNYLVLIRQEPVLPALFGRVLTAPAVVQEMLHTTAPQAVRAWAAAPPKWLEVREPTSLVTSLRLGPGELAAISLANELKADAVLIDERKGAQAAADLGLLVTGTLGILRIADEKALLRMEDAVASLRGTSFRASDRLLDDLVREARERRGAGGYAPPP